MLMYPADLAVSWPVAVDEKTVIGIWLLAMKISKNLKGRSLS